MIENLNRHLVLTAKCPQYNLLVEATGQNMVCDLCVLAPTQVYDVFSVLTKLIGWFLLK